MKSANSSASGHCLAFSRRGGEYLTNVIHCHGHHFFVTCSPSPISTLPPWLLLPAGGLDFSLLSSTLTLAVGADVRCVEVTVLEDRLEEDAEVFVVQVESLSPAGTVVIGQGTVRVIVMDNDEPGT